ncbi:MAG: potassium transporter Kef [Polyangiaceae bacterium]|jgi:Kef-type K+ transport system membrane component KefB
MNAILLPMGLLVLSYLGSLWMSRRTGGAAGLPSGVEFAALGFVLGPHALDIVSANDLRAFEPVVEVAIGWLAFAVGMDFGFMSGRRVRLRSLALGSLSALLSGGAVAAGAWATIGLLQIPFTATDRIIVCGGVGTACSETTRYAVRWVAGKSSAKGPLADHLDELAHADSLIPIVAVAVIFAVEPSRAVLVPMPLCGWPAITAILGLLLGGGAALLLRSEMPIEDTWGVLFGVSLLAVGTAARLQLSTLMAAFFMGIAVSALTGHSAQLRAMVAPTERPVLLPALLLAGARLDFHATHALPWIAACAIVARFAAKMVVGWVLAITSPPARRGGPLVGLSLMSSGALAMCIGLAFDLRFPNATGDTVLAVAVLSAVAGEFVGPARLRHVLAAAGEIDAEQPSVRDSEEARA